MKLIHTTILFFVFTISIVHVSHAQTVGINDDGSSPNAKSMLDVKSNTKGLLIPRMSTSDRLGIAPTNSEKGLMVYDTTVSAFFYHTGVEWKEVSEALWMKDPIGINRTSHVGINTLASGKHNLSVVRPAGVTGPDTSTIYAYRVGDESNETGGGGSSFTRTGIDAAIKGYSDWGNPFSAGVAGYGYLDYGNSAAVIGAQVGGTIYGALGFTDTSNVIYAGFYRGNTRTVGNTEVTGDAQFNNDVFVDNQVGIGTTDIPSGVGLHVMSNNIRLEGSSKFFDIVSTSPSNYNGVRFFNGATFQGALFYEADADLLNITGFSTIPVLVTDLANYKVGIGTFDMAAGYILSVNGKAIVEELRIQNSTLWPDYVFAEDYALMDLHALEHSINQNKHLPGIPAAAEIEEDGILVGDMQKRMMEKIEELTLYIIQLNKRIENLEQENDMLKE